MSSQRTSLMRKRASRLAATQALYARALRGEKGVPARMVSQVTQHWLDSKRFDAADLPHDVQPEQALLTSIVESAVANRTAIEEAIESIILPNWKKTRMSLPLLSTLRAAAAEALVSERSRGLLVEEYTEVAAQLVDDSELTYAHKAFNLLLDALRPGDAQAHG